MTISISARQYTQFRKMLVERRKAAKMSQVDLAKKLNSRQTFISKYETGERRIDVLELLTIAEAIGFDPCEFMEELKK